MSGFAAYEQYDALGLADLVRKGEVTSAELVDACIERIEAKNPKLNAVVHQQYDLARQRAAGELPDGPFKGVPFLLKDLGAEEAGQPSTSSCRLFENWRPERDCELVARFKKAGVVIVGRTNTPEFGIYGVTESAMRGPARNPWNPDHSPGGSSGGTAAAVAARLVPMAHGADGGGSIRIPSSNCGLFGIKPTRARNPMGPYTSEGWGGQVCDHVLTRSVRDSAAMLDATHGSEPGSIYQVERPQRPFSDEVGADPGKLRIAFTKETLFGGETHPDCVAAVEDAAKLADSLGHTVGEALPEFDQRTLVRAYLITVAAGVASDVRHGGLMVGRKPRASDVEPATWMLKMVAEATSSADYRWHELAKHKVSRDLGQFFEKWDVMLTPTCAVPPVKIGAFDLKLGEKLQLAFLRLLPFGFLIRAALGQMAKGPFRATPNTQLFNVTGQPAMSVPLFWNDAGLPIGTQWVGRFGDEATLFRLASQLEQARPWKDRAP
ncbi:MAG: amidase [Myxococcota bacterium]